MPKVIGQKLFSASATAKHGLGEYYEIGCRGFRYALAGASALVAGNVLQSRVEEATHDALVIVTGDAGSRDVTLTTEASTGALDANEYAGGWLVIDTTPGIEVPMYEIDSHPAIAASSNGTIRLREPLEYALTTTTRVTLMFNPYSKVIQFPVTTATGVPVGVAVYPTTAAYYGWVQTRGPCGVLIAGTPAAGAMVTAVGAVAGAASIFSSTLPVIGRMMETGRDTKVCPVWLTID